MSRTERLLELLQVLRAYRQPVSGAQLSQQMQVSLRTIYRDIASLQAQGAHIVGEAGSGFILRPGFMLPPLMFSEEEIEALVLGSRWVAERGDRRLASAAQVAMDKIKAVLPTDLCNALEHNALLVPPANEAKEEDISLSQIRAAIRHEKKATLHYRNAQGQASERQVWPFALGFFERVQVLIAWCELRQEIRHFRTDRISAMQVHEERYPKRKQALLKEWRALEGITKTP